MSTVFREARGWNKNSVRLVCAVALLCGLCACSFDQFAARRAADALAGTSGAFAAEDDAELAAAAIPFALKSVEALLDRVPDHRGLLTAAAGGFTQYAYAVVQLPADELEERDVAAAYAQRARARALYLRARDYGLRGLRLDGPEARRRLRKDPAKSVAATTSPDAELLYWTGASWAAAIALGKDDPALLSELPVAEAIARRASALAPDLGEGALQVFLLSLEVSLPNASPAAISTARQRFQRAVTLSKGAHAAPYVALAEAIAQLHGDAAEFEGLLRSALSIDLALRPDWRLANRIAQRRARWLLTQTSFLFPE